MSQNNNLSSLWTPKAIMMVGVPSIIALFLTLVITGLVPTPLMEGLRLIPRVYSQHEDLGAVFQKLLDIEKETLRVQLVQCERLSQTLEQQRECYNRTSKETIDTYPLTFSLPQSVVVGN